MRISGVFTLFLKRSTVAPALIGTGHPAVGATGLGGGVTAACAVGLPLTAGLDHGGGDAGGYGKFLYRVPQRDLVVGQQFLFEQGMIQTAKGLTYREALVQEFGDMRVKVTRAGNVVSALSLACWAVRKAGGLGGMERRGRVVWENGDTLDIRSGAWLRSLRSTETASRW